MPKVYNEVSDNMDENCSEEEKTIDNTEIIFEKKEDESTIIGVVSNGRNVYFTSRYSSNKLADIWCRYQDISNFSNIVVLFGMADGGYARKLREINNEMLIIIFEPSTNLMDIIKKNKMIDDLFSDDNIFIISGEENQINIYKILVNIINLENYKYVRFFVSPNYEIVYGNIIDNVKKTIVESIDMIKINRNTVLVLKDEINKNIANNILDCVEQYSVKSLKDKMDNIDKNDIPAIIVAAGPSLDKNVNLLKKAKGKAFIIAVDTALNTLANADVLPDIAVTVDPHKPLSLFSDEKMVNIPIVFHMAGNSKIRTLHKGKRFYQNSTDSILSVFDKKYEIENFGLESGGSVSNDAYSLAQKLGFKTIIFIGLDLAYPNDKEHSEHSYGKEKNNVIVNSDNKYFLVEDVFGGEVRTESNMNVYRLWFEKAVQVYKDIRHIDATEGGAKKNGMEIMTLSDAIEELCLSSKSVDFSSIIDSSEHYYTEKQREEIYVYFSTLEGEMLRIKQKLKNGLTYYSKLNELNKIHQYSGKEFENTINIITEINEWTTKDEEVVYLAMYSAEKDFEIRDKIYEHKDNLYEDINHIVKSGMEMIESLLDSADIFLKDMKEVIEISKEKCEIYK